MQWTRAEPGRVLASYVKGTQRIVSVNYLLGMSLISDLKTLNLVQNSVL